MNQTCKPSGCKADVAYAIVDEKKVYRITFSLSLAEYIAKITNKQVKKVTLHLGKELSVGDTSESGLYAICKAKNLWPLRVTFFKELAELWKSDTTVIYECKLQT